LAQCPGEDYEIRHADTIDGLCVHGDVAAICGDVASVIAMDMEDGAACLDVPTLVFSHISSVAFYTVVTL
jgi:hypothetical protein